MKTIVLSIFICFFLSCTKESDDIIEVTNIDQIVGIWKWEATCGGFNPTCTYPSATNYAQIEFKADGKYIEMRNDTVFHKTNYRIDKINAVSGTLYLEDLSSIRTVSVADNKLYIQLGELKSTYSKIK